ncbi:unnamed protein product [Lymnaea stagnalis]|uniref:Glycosyltransferase family 92 protein n=1 Tax=Lymnaea stagnalis TaxID=6523 RepID=A0AAV2I1W1_LYMST
MANYIKRLKGYVAPLLVIYTILVTFFLAQTAWNDDVTTAPQKRSHVTFLDVLVQEERRHMRSFQDIVQSNRVVQKAKSRVTRRRRNRHNNVSSDDTPVGRHGLPSNPEFRALNDLFTQSNASDPGDVVTSVLLDHDPVLNQDTLQPGVNRPIFKVEVEEPESPGGSQQPQELKASENSSYVGPVKKPLNKSLYMNSRRSNAPKTYFPQEIGIPPSEVTYSIEYCDKTFRDLSETSNICNRNIVEVGSDNYVAVSDYSLPFRPIGDINIYSAFLDQRVSPPVVRLMTIGPQGRDGTRSIYWCLFYRQVRGGNTDKKNGTSKMRQLKRATQLSYWAASDGHRAAQQFYIMSCAVPEEAMAFLTMGQAGSMRLVSGGENDSTVEAARESVTFRVINNGIAASGHGNTFHPRNKREYFHKMEEDLSKLTETVRGNSHDVNSDDEDSRNDVGAVSSNPDNQVSGHSQNVHVGDDNQRIKTSPEDSQNDAGPQTGYERPDDRIVACVAPLQGSVGVIQIVEFIELTLLLGSQHIVFYTFRGDYDVASVLKMYEARGLVTVVEWRIPSPASLWAKGRDVALNDCLYRTMSLYDYAIFLDLDEFFVPRATPDMPSFLKYLRVVHNFNSTRFSDLVFSSTYFPPPVKPEFQNLTSAPGFTKDVSKFVSLKSLRRSSYNTQHTLRMVKITRAFRVGPGERRKSSFTINPRYASVHHYSHCPRDTSADSQSKGPNLNVLVPGKSSKGSMDNGSPGGHKGSVLGGAALGSSRISEKVSNDLCSHKKVDWIMWRYKTKLIERTKKSVRHFNRG